jgi:hypothetical protein
MKRINDNQHQRQDTCIPSVPPAAFSVVAMDFQCQYRYVFVSDISVFIEHVSQSDDPGIAHIFILRLRKSLTNT